jgi:hypothetical protein
LIVFGRSSEADREAWRKLHYGTPVEEAKRLGQVADAYAHGWLAGRVGADLTPESREELRAMAYAFGIEYEHAAWLHVTAGSARPGYARAWEEALATRGY